MWICPDPLGHLQATGIDSAGRKQYLYHEQWRARRDREKFDRMLAFAGRLPRLRRATTALLEGKDLTRERVLAGAVRLLDLGFFRIGSESYAEANETFGLATMRKTHVRLAPECALVFDYAAKGGQRRVQSVVDPAVYGLVEALKRRRNGRELLAYRTARAWVDITSTDINDFIRQQAGGPFTAKDFRTWNATVLAAAALGVARGAAGTKTGRRRAKSLAVDEVARYLRQHADRVQDVVHRPTGLRPLRRRGDDRSRSSSGSAVPWWGTPRPRLASMPPFASCSTAAPGAGGVLRAELRRRRAAPRRRGSPEPHSGSRGSGTRDRGP